MFIIFYSSTILDQFILLIVVLTAWLLKGDALILLLKRVTAKIKSLFEDLVANVTAVYQRAHTIKSELLYFIKQRHIIVIRLMSFFVDEQTQYCEVNSCTLCTSHGKSVQFYIFRKKKSDCIEQNE